MKSTIKYGLVLLGLALLAGNGITQSQAKMDSLQIEIARHPERDTHFVNRLNTLGNYFLDTNGDTAIQVLTLAIQIADSLHFKGGLTQGYITLGNAWSDKGDMEKALFHYRHSLSVATEMKHFTLMGKNYLNIGNRYRILGQIDSVLPNYEKAIKYLVQVEDQSGLAMVLINTGSYYVDLGDLEKGLDYLTQAQKILEKTGAKRSLGYTYVNMAVIKVELEQYEAAEAYTMKAIHLFEEIGEKRGLAGAYSQLADMEAHQKSLDSSIVHFRKSLEIGRTTSDRQLICHALGRIGNSYLLLHNLDSAKYYFQESLKSNEAGAFREDLFESYFGLGNVYQDLKAYGTSLQHYKKAMELALEIQDRGRRSDVYKELSNTYMLMGDYKNAFLNFKEQVAIQDSMLDEEKVSSLNEMSIKYETEKKDHEIRLLNKDKEIQQAEIRKQKLLKNFLIVGLALLLILFFLGYKTYHTRQLLKLQMLRNKIATDLHDDVGSTLTSISIFSEIAKNQSSEVVPMLDQIGESSRKMLESMADIVWTINPENDNVEKIIWRMRSFAYELLVAKNIDFQFEVEETVTQMQLSMEVRKNLYLIFKEAINNMVKYAGATRAFLALQGTKNNLTMLIRDNGKGFDSNLASEGNGLRNMKKRAEDIGATLLIESVIGTGTTIQFNLVTA